MSSISMMGFIVKWWKRQLILRATRQTIIMIFPLVQHVSILIGCSTSVLSSGTLEGRRHVQIISTNVLAISRLPRLTRIMFAQNLRHSYLNKYVL